MTDSSLFAARIGDIADAALKNGVAYTRFLSEDEADLCASIIKKTGLLCRFYGGVKDAERRICAVYDKSFSEDWMCFPIAAVVVTLRDKTATVTHRDCLGSLMGLGLNRDVIGDIVISGNTVCVAVYETVAGHITSELTRIGRCVCDTEMLPSFEGIESNRKFTDVTVTVASERLDCIVAALCGASREKAVEHIKAGKVLLNGTEITDVSKKLVMSDKLTIRGSGKFIFDSSVDTCKKTKKGRLIINLKKYDISK